MKLTRIQGAARGQRIDIEIGDGVTLIAGPTGSWKTTTLNLIPLAINGSVRSRGRVVRRAHDVFLEMGGTPDDRVATKLHFEADGEPFFIRRRIDGVQRGSDKISVSQKADDSGLDGSVARQVGDVANLDIMALLAQSGPKRAQAMLDMCRPFDDGSRDSDWCIERWRTIVGDVMPLAWTDAGTTFASLQATLESARRAVLDARDERNRQQRAVDALEPRASADPPMPGTPDDIKRLIDHLNQDIATAERRLGEADPQRGKALEAELARILALPSVEEAKATVQALEERRRDLQQQLTDLGPEPEPWTAPDLSALESSAERAARAVREARDQTAAQRGRVSRLEASIDKLEETPFDTRTCPTCEQAVDDDHMLALAAQLENEQKTLETLERTMNIAIQSQMAMAGVLKDARKSAQDDRVSHARAAVAYAADRNQLRGDLDSIPGQLRQAAAIVEAAEQAEDRRADIQAQLDSIEPVDVENIRLELDGARKRREELQAARDTIIAQREARESMASAARARDAAAAQIGPAKRARDAWEMVLADYTDAMFTPFIEACAEALPPRWTLRFDLKRSAFEVERPGRPAVDLTSLSQGEQVMALSACAVGMARTAGNPWRVAIVDHAEALSNWPTPEAPDGLFARFVSGLQAAIEADMIDQAIIAYSRLPTDAEVRHVDVVHLTAPKDVSNVDEVAAIIHSLDLKQVRALLKKGLKLKRAPQDLDRARALALTHVANWHPDLVRAGIEESML